MRPPKNSWERQPRRRGFDDDQVFGEMPSMPSFPTITSTAPEMRATVKWYNPEKGFGFVELSDGSGDAFLHANTLQASGHQAVNPGATLQVRVGRGQKGPQVDQVVSVDETTAEQPRSRGPAGGGGGGMAGPRPRTGGRQVDLSTAVEMEGVVKWYNPDKGFGFIAPQGGGKDVFVHATALERGGLSGLQDGQPVRMKVVQGAKGLEVGSIDLM